MKPTTSSSQIALLLTLIDESFQKKAWHGPNLRGSIRGISAKAAARRPSPKRHNIWEIVVHCAYWKYIVRRRILDLQKGSFACKGSNWFRRPETLDENSWRKDIALLEKEHRAMRAAIASLKDSALSTIPRGSKVSNRAIISGIASHDVYHAGQIQLLKRLLRR